MRIVATSVLCASAALFSFGCSGEIRGPSVGITAEVPSVEVDAPLIEGPGVLTVDVEPPIEQRQYVYEEGYPPGVYLYGGFYYYGGHRYEHDVFINRVVHENVRQHRYVNVEENRKAGARVVEKQRVEFQKTGGHRAPPKAAEHPAKAEHREVAKPPEHHEVAKPEHHEVAKPEHHEVAKPEHHETVTPEHHETTVKPEHHETVKPEPKAVRPPEKPVKPVRPEDKDKQ